MSRTRLPSDSLTQDHGIFFCMAPACLQNWGLTVLCLGSSGFIRPLNK